MTLLAKPAEHGFMHNLEPFLREQRGLAPNTVRELIQRLDDGGLAVDQLVGVRANGSAALADTVAAMTRHGFVEFVTADRRSVVLTPCSRDFELVPVPPVREGTWRMSRFAYTHVEGGEFLVRSPVADCFLKVRDADAAALVHAFVTPTDVATLLDGRADHDEAAAVCGALARAAVILPCDDDGNTVDEIDPSRRPWNFHDLLFHSLSRLGRSEKAAGGTYRFADEFPCPPAVKQHQWTDVVIPLPHADIQGLTFNDVPLTAAIELRRSTRRHSIVPLSKREIGEFLSRVARVRHQYSNEYGDFTSRPYPGGGALYESEFYLTIDAALDVPRGFYYYDPVAHALCLVAPPNDDTAGLLDEAWMATAGQCRPQILVTIASRFNRFNWKYESMSYAAQLKNVGVIYQTMYLVATAMNIAACGLGMGNTSRFERLTGLDYLDEGSIGEFMLGRPG